MFSFQLFLLILACLWLSEVEAATHTDTLNYGDNLSVSDRLVSQDRKVTLGFYTQDYGTTSGSYLAMWYTLDNSSHPLWLANRDHPIADKSANLVIDNSGLKILHSGRIPIQLFSLKSTTSNPINSSSLKLVLNYSGNLILQGTNSNGENIVLWQSFDYPTDTLLPGMKLGVSHGRNRLLTSWLSDSTPAPGSFTLQWDSIKERFVVRLRERVIWTSGVKFANFPRLSHIFTTVVEEDEQYVTILVNQYASDVNEMLVLQENGSLALVGHNWEISFSISRDCDGNSTETGCERWEGPECRKKGDKYVMRSIRPTDTDSTNVKLSENHGLSLGDCKNICWKDCNCLGINAEKEFGCEFLSGPYEEGALDATQYEMIIRSGSSSRSRCWIWILIFVAMAVMIPLLLGILIYLRRPRRIRMEENYLVELMTSDDTSDI